MNGIVMAIDALRRRPKVLLGGFVFILGAIIFYAFIAHKHHEPFNGFWAIFGLAGCIGMTKFMKGIGYAFLMQPHDFYKKIESGEEN